jgi:hypothetical protein
MNTYRIIEVHGSADQVDHVESLDVRIQADSAKTAGVTKATAESTAWDKPTELPQRWLFAAPWRADVEQRRVALENDLARLDKLTADQVQERDALRALLKDAGEATQERVWLAKWWWGTEVERAWTRLHEVEERMIDLLPEAELEARAMTTSINAAKALKGDDKQLVAFDLLRVAATTDRAKVSALRPVIVEMQRRMHSQTDRDNHEARYLRNRILIGSSLCVLTSAALLLAQRRLTGLPFLESTDVLAGKPTTYLFLVMLFAAVGALLTAVPSFLQVPSDFSPFNLPLQQGLLKIVSGPVVAVVGFAIVNSDMVNVGVPTTASAVLVLAVVFGAAQHLVTRYVDRRADEVLGALAPEKKTDA